tara:strand:- start:96 stop:254 length:159 start_codon:yes stop_codon:yes gene_type:complete
MEKATDIIAGFITILLSPILVVGYSIYFILAATYWVGKGAKKEVKRKLFGKK